MSDVFSDPEFSALAILGALDPGLVSQLGKSANWLSDAVTFCTGPPTEWQPGSASQPGTMRHHSQGKTSALVKSTDFPYQPRRCSTFRTNSACYRFTIRTIGGKCHKCSTTSKRKCALCAEHDSPIVKHESGNGVTAKPTITAYLHTV